MTLADSIRLARVRATIHRDIAELDRAIQEIALSGTATATLSSSGGSKSYTRLDLDKLRAYRKDLATRAARLADLAAGSRAGVRRIVTTRLGVWG